MKYCLEARKTLQKCVIFCAVICLSLIWLVTANQQSAAQNLEERIKWQEIQEFSDLRDRGISWSPDDLPLFHLEVVGADENLYFSAFLRGFLTQPTFTCDELREAIFFDSSKIQRNRLSLIEAIIADYGLPKIVPKKVNGLLVESDYIFEHLERIIQKAIDNPNDDRFRLIGALGVVGHFYDNLASMTCQYPNYSKRAEKTDYYKFERFSGPLNANSMLLFGIKHFEDSEFVESLIQQGRNSQAAEQTLSRYCSKSEYSDTYDCSLVPNPLESKFEDFVYIAAALQNKIRVDIGSFVNAVGRTGQPKYDKILLDGFSVTNLSSLSLFKTIEIKNSPFVKGDLTHWVGDKFAISDSHIDNINLQHSSISEFLIEQSLLVNSLQLDHTKINTADIMDTRGYASGGSDNSSHISGYMAEFADFDISSSRRDKFELGVAKYDTSQSAFNSVFLGRVTAGVLRIEGTFINDYLNMWGSNIERAFIRYNSSIGGTVDLNNSKINWMSIHGGKNKNRIGRIIGGDLTSNIGIRIVNIKTAAIDMSDMRAGSLYLSCVDSEEKIGLLGLTVDTYFEASRTTTPYINLSYFSGKEILISASKPEREVSQEQPKISEVDEKISNPSCSEMPSEVSLFSAESSIIILDHPLSGDLGMDNVQADLVYISDWKARIANVDLRFFWSIRYADIRSLAIPVSFLLGDNINGTDRKPYFDLEGSKIGSIRPFNRTMDVRPSESKLRTIERVTTNRDQFDKLIMESLLPALGIYSERLGDSPYASDAYRILRTSALEAGLPDLEKEIAVLQNDHFAVIRDHGATRMLYSLGKWINSYGYEQSRGVLILIGLFLTGFIIMNIEVIIWPLRKAYLSIYDKICIMVINTRMEDWIRPRSEDSQRTQSPSVSIRSLFLAIDRTIPSLALDDDFASPSKARLKQQTDVLVVENLIPAWKIYLLYILRLCSFIVTIYLIGGVFNIFQ